MVINLPNNIPFFQQTKFFSVIIIIILQSVSLKDPFVFLHSNGQIKIYFSVYSDGDSRWCH